MPEIAAMEVLVMRQEKVWFQYIVKQPKYGHLDWKARLPPGLKVFAVLSDDEGPSICELLQI
jgi:hypothetical protein